MNTSYEYFLWLKVIIHGPHIEAFKEPPTPPPPNKKVKSIYIFKMKYQSALGLVCHERMAGWRSDREFPGNSSSALDKFW